MGSGAEEKAYHRTGLGKYLALLLFHCMYVIVLEVKKKKKKVHPEIVCNSLLSFKLL